MPDFATTCIYLRPSPVSHKYAQAVRARRVLLSCKWPPPMEEAAQPPCSLIGGSISQCKPAALAKAIVHLESHLCTFALGGLSYCPQLAIFETRPSDKKV